MGKHYSGLIWLMAVVLFSGCVGMNKQIDFQAVDLSPKLEEGQYLQKVNNFVVIVDASQSMSEPYKSRSKFLYAKEIAIQLNRTIPDLRMGGALDSFGAINSPFGTRVLSLYGLTDYVKGDFETALQTIVWSGGTSPLASAMHLAEKTLAPAEGKLAVIIISDGKEMDNSPVSMAAQMKDAFGERLCIYTVVVGTDPGGRKLLEEVAAKGECGMSVSADDIVGPQPMAYFVEKVFLALDSDRDGVPDDLDECPETPLGVKVDEKGCPFDTDGDGVYDYIDQCPDTPMGVKVDEKGCPFDTDGDGVYDYLDQCPDTPMGVKVDEKGCPFDTDGDGVYDYLDKCPDTPMGVKVDEVGCPLDSDADGVYDYLDKCPDTPIGVKVDELGCPLDSDADGVYDYLDQCPDTPIGVKVDEKGCPIDSDKDGVPDYLDQCPDTPMGVKVDNVGCPFDSDKDGVYDYMDQCPDTPMGVKVDEKGCPFDSDGDGVYDHLDQCPDTPKGARVDERGCWVLGNVLFDFGKADIKPGSHRYLDEIAEIIQKNPSLKVEVQGHTDDVGSAEYNNRLSIKRAKAVVDYLKSKGVSGDRLPATGYGFSRPVASNNTDEGRSKNRRTEFHPIFSK